MKLKNFLGVGTGILFVLAGIQSFGLVFVLLYQSQETLQWLPAIVRTILNLEVVILGICAVMIPAAVTFSNERQPLAAFGSLFGFVFLPWLDSITSYFNLNLMFIDIICKAGILWYIGSLIALTLALISTKTDWMPKALFAIAILPSLIYIYQLLWSLNYFTDMIGIISWHFFLAVYIFTTTRADLDYIKKEML